MKFLMTYEQKTPAAPPTPEKMAAIAAFGQEMTKAGVLIMTGGLQRSTKGVRVQLSGKEFTVTDGPFAETKEFIDGFALIEVKSKDEALEVARQFMMIAGDGHGEVLQVFQNGEGQPHR
jgi:hypothetical protein